MGHVGGAGSDRGSVETVIPTFTHPHILYTLYAIYTHIHIHPIHYTHTLPQAKGGVLAQLAPFIKNKAMKSYNSSDVNLDFEVIGWVEGGWEGIWEGVWEGVCRGNMDDGAYIRKGHICT